MMIQTPDGTTVEAIPNCPCRPFPDSLMQRDAHGRWICPRRHWWNFWRHLHGSKGGGIDIPPGATITFSAPIPIQPADRHN
jgi:hypothetical protein